MTIRLRTAFFIALALFIVWFLFIERAILTPFILAAIFAYVFNPIVDFFTHKIKLPRILSILIIYIVIISVVLLLGAVFTKRIIEESSDFKIYVQHLLITTKTEVNIFPDWARPSIRDGLSSLVNIRLINSSTVFEFFPKAISRIISLFIFIFSAFYFLKEGHSFINKFMTYVPFDYKLDAEILMRKINQVLSGYLRGQIFMVILVGLVLYIALSLMGVRFALILAVFSGVAEIVPIIGPIVAGGVAALITVFTGGSHVFPITPIQSGLIVIVVYFVVRQIQDYFVSPIIMGRITKLPPIVILFSVLAGEHSFGIMGLILAVPTAAVVKLVIDFCFDKINDAGQVKK